MGGVPSVNFWEGEQESASLRKVQACTKRPEEYAAEAAISAELGFSAFKYRPALGPEEDLRTVQPLMREAVGPDIGLCLDAHGWFRMGDQSYTPEQIERMAQELSHMGSHGWEEPFPPKTIPPTRSYAKRT